MKVETVSMKDLISPEYNPRLISDEELRKLKRSIHEFGYVRPILVNRVNNHIVGGNQTYKALKQLGHAEVDVVYVTIEDLNKEKALNLALNKINGDFDDEKLEQIFDDLSSVTDFDLSLSGFDDCEIEDLFGDIGSNIDFDDSVFEDVIIDDVADSDSIDSDSEPERVVVDDSNKKNVSEPVKSTVKNVKSSVVKEEVTEEVVSSNDDVDVDVVEEDVVEPVSDNIKDDEWEKPKKSKKYIPTPDYIPIAPVKRIIKECGAERVSDDAGKLLASVLEENAKQISEKAIMMANVAGRKTIHADDLEIILNS